VADQYLQKRIASSVDAAMTCSKEINPSLCEQYVSLWKQDLGAWEQTLKDLPRQLPVKAALRELDLKPSDQNPYVLAGIIPRNRNDIRNDITAGARVLPSQPAVAAVCLSQGPPRPRCKQATVSAELPSTAWAELPWNASCGLYWRWRKNHPSQRSKAGKAVDWPSAGTESLPNLPSPARLRFRLIPKTPAQASELILLA
jgi:hypothetical protein